MRRLQLLYRFKSYFFVSIFVCILFGYFRCASRDRTTDFVPKHLQKFVRFSEEYSCSGDGPGLGTAGGYGELQRRNERREVRNLRRFGPVREDTPVLAVRVARDPERLQYLIVSLAQVDDIHAALVVFSHSFYDERVDELIRTIEFCMVAQIYYLNSVQLFPNAFPGAEPGDCGESEGGGRRARCARLAEAKHHWWWTARAVFSEEKWARALGGTVLFLEESGYALPDLLHVLRRATAALALAPAARLIALGRPSAPRLPLHRLTVNAWRPPYDYGLAFNVTLWRNIEELSRHFCEYDDTSWSRSLRHALERGPHGVAVMVASVAPRVVSTGGYTSGARALRSLWRLTLSAELFPARVEAVLLCGRGGALYRRRRPPPAGNGGWADVRDLMLCLDPMAYPTTEDDSTTTPPIFTTPLINPAT